MAELQCFRSLYGTLTAAASTLGLFAVSNWGLAGVIGDAQNRGIPQQVVFHTHVAFAVPLVALYLSVYNALQVWAVKKSLFQTEGREKYPDHGSIAIITLCPIYIQFPAAAIPADELDALMVRNSYRRVETQEQDQEQHELLEVCPLELRPISDALPQANMNGEEAGVRAGDNVVDDDDEGPMVCIQLPDTSPLSDGQRAIDRLVLLCLDLVPRSKELSFLPSRNRFQSAITAIQAMGYTFTVLQRFIYHLGISPVEAIITFLSIIVTFQLAIEVLYASGVYQRPLLIRLNTQQFHLFREGRREDRHPHFRRTGVIFKLMVLFSWMLVSGPSIYYSYHYWHIHMTGCAIAALTFLIAQTLLGMLLTFIACSGMDVDNVSFPMVFISALVYACSFMIAVGYTVKYWDHFHKRIEVHSHDWFSWILRFLPRLSS